MEKKEIDKRFYLTSLLNLIPAFIFGGGLTLDTASLMGAVIILMINHTILVKLVKSLTQGAVQDGDTGRQASKIIILMLLKFTLLFGMVAFFYFYKRHLITKLFFIIVLQLIIQVFSIKNNYQNS